MAVLPWCPHLTVTVTANNGDPLKEHDFTTLATSPNAVNKSIEVVDPEAEFGIAITFGRACPFPVASMVANIYYGAQLHAFHLIRAQQIHDNGTIGLMKRLVRLEGGGVDEQTYCFKDVMQGGGEKEEEEGKAAVAKDGQNQDQSSTGVISLRLNYVRHVSRPEGIPKNKQSRLSLDDRTVTPLEYDVIGDVPFAVFNFECRAVGQALSKLANAAWNVRTLVILPGPVRVGGQDEEEDGEEGEPSSKRLRLEHAEV